MERTRPALARTAAAVIAALALTALAAGCNSKSASTGGASAGASAAASTPAPSAPPSSPASSSGQPTSCSVITVAQASAALGQQVKPPILGKAVVEGGVACVYYGPDVPAGVSPDNPVGDTVRVVLVTGPNAKKWFDDYRTKVQAQPISGLGDAAYYDGYASISVLKGDAYVRIAVGIANNLQPEETLARDALPNM